MKKDYYIFKINLNKLNIVATMILIFMFIFTYFLFPNVIFKGVDILKNTNHIFLLIPIMFGYFVLHELLHSLSYVIYGAKFKNITYGIELEKGVFYCLCKQEITKKNILNSLMYPLFYIGIVTYVISIIINSPLLLLLSITNISGSAADIMYFNFISRLPKDIKFSELDDGTSFAILSNKNITAIKHFGLDYVEKQKSIERNDLKKIKISRLSYIVLIICAIITIIDILM